MFVTKLSTDLWGRPTDVRDDDVPAPSRQQIEAAIRALDGKRRTMVTLGGDGESHLTVGGGSPNRYVVYMTFDNMEFLNLMSHDRADKTVTLFVGGQDGPFPDNTVVDITLALRAAKAFAETGQPDPSCKWS
jgi:immunity protein Imm1 of predicted polymorphic toxin system